MLRNQKASPDSFKTALTEAADELGIPTKFHFYMYPHAKDTVFRVVFNSK